VAILKAIQGLTYGIVSADNLGKGHGFPCFGNFDRDALPESRVRNEDNVAVETSDAIALGTDILDLDL
jgi:hypothetical protein